MPSLQFAAHGLYNREERAISHELKYSFMKPPDVCLLALFFRTRFVCEFCSNHDDSLMRVLSNWLHCERYFASLYWIKQIALRRVGFKGMHQSTSL